MESGVIREGGRVDSKRGLVEGGPLKFSESD